VFLAQLDEQFAKRKQPRGPAAGFRRARKLVEGLSGVRRQDQRLRPTTGSEDPVRLIEIFALAEREAAGNPPRNHAHDPPRCQLIDADTRKDRAPMRCSSKC
jgi:[protein-PII] uridylyltransferase